MHLEKIGLRINPDKSVAIHIQDGELVPGELPLIGGGSVRCIDVGTTIRYLGCSFREELLVFDTRIAGSITEKLENLSLSQLLKRDQKLNVMNQYIFAQLTYPLQTAPLRKIKDKDFEVLDLNTKATLKSTRLSLHAVAAERTLKI